MDTATDESSTDGNLGERVTTAPPSKASWLDAMLRTSVLRHKHFRNVWIASIVSNIGTWMEMMGVQMTVAKTTGSLTSLGYFAAAQLAPILVLGLIGGIVSDRVNRRRLLVFTQLLLMIVALGLTILSYTGGEHLNPFIPESVPGGEHRGLIAGMFLLSLVQGIVMAFNIPAWQVLTPRLVPRDELTRAITLNGIQFNLARVIGPALAGYALHLWGPTPVFALNTMTFLAIVIAVWFTPDAPAPANPPTHPWTQVKQAFGFIFNNRGPLAVFIAMVLMSFLAAPLIRMLPLVVIDVLGVSEEASDGVTGMLMSMLGVGAVAAGIGMRFVPSWYPKHHFIPLALFGAGASVTFFSMSTTIPWAIVSMIVVGAFWILGFNPVWAAMQHLVPDNMRGRVLSVANVAAFGANALGNIAAGWIGDALSNVIGSRAVGTSFAEGSLSILLTIAGLVMIVYRVPEIDGLSPEHPEYKPRRSLIAGVLATAHRPRTSDPTSLAR